MVIDNVEKKDAGGYMLKASENQGCNIQVKCFNT